MEGLLDLFVAFLRAERGLAANSVDAYADDVQRYLSHLKDKQGVRSIEKVKPDNVRLIQVRLPQINSRNEVTLDMEVGAQSQGPVIEFLKRLQDSPLFGPTNLSRQSPPTQNEPLWRFRVTVSYAQKL